MIAQPAQSAIPDGKLIVADSAWHQIPQSPNFPPPSTATTAGAVKRSSLPPGFRGPAGHLHNQQYHASPLQQALTPPPPDPAEPNDPEPFPSVESSIESAGSGQNFHISATGLPTAASSVDDSSPLQQHARPYQHSQSSSFGSKADTMEVFCASCTRPWLLKTCFACTECICAVCSDCVGQIISGPVMTAQPGFAPVRRGCPRCAVIGGKWKKFQLEFR